MRVGIDTVEIERIEKLYKKEGHNFLIGFLQKKRKRF